MLDVLHVLYEEDVSPTWENGIEVKDRVREAIYDKLYNRKYQFASTEPETGRPGGVTPDGFGGASFDASRFNEADLPPGEQPVKPYIKPMTEEELFKALGEQPLR